MSEWWTYRPSDFLLFSPRVYERLIESHNAGLWPWQVAAVGLGLMALALVLRGGRAGGGALVIVGAGLAFSGWSFVWSRYAGINWAAAYFAPAFWVAGAAFAVAAAAVRVPLRTIDRAGSPAVFLIVLALLYPLTAPALCRGWSGMEVAGLTPDPTALAALGLAALLRAPLLAAALALVPLAWTLYALMTLWTLGAPQAWIMAAGLALFAAAVVARLFRRRSADEPEASRPT